MDLHYRCLENMYASANCNKAYTNQVRITKGEAGLTLDVSPDYFHAMGAVHGHVYFKMLDDAAYFAAASLVTDYAVLTAGFNLHMLRPITSGTMRAEGRVVHHSRNLILAESSLYDERDRLLGKGSGSFMRGKVAMDQIPGYQAEPPA